MRKTDRTASSTALNRYLSDIRSLPRLSKEQEIEVGERAAQGRRESLDELVVANLGFVVKIASDYVNLGLPLDDLLNEGNLGLIRAAARYDHSRKIKFITYASFWVRKSILKALDDQSSMIREPSYQRAKRARQRAIDEAARGSVRPKTRWPALRVVSLDDPCAGADERRLADMLADARAVDPEKEIARQEALHWLRDGLSWLNEKERAVIIWRFGLRGEPVLTLREIGLRLGVSRERVRQVEMAARHRLRMHLVRGRAESANERPASLIEARGSC